VARRLQPYLDTVQRENEGGTLGRYPGSPAIALGLMRAQDRLIANELHPEQRMLLTAAIGGDRRAKVMGLDAWVALKALLPPRERRAVVLIDPPFEARDDLDRMAAGLTHCIKRFASATIIAWYPIKDPTVIANFHAAVAGLALPKCIVAEVMIQPATNTERLNGCGLVVVNPPFTLEDDLAIILPELSRRLARGSAGACHRVTRVGSGLGASESTKKRMRSRP
jgi:23S rRNA (adenine2030-N6)-methyltransferase